MTRKTKIVIYLSLSLFLLGIALLNLKSVDKADFQPDKDQAYAVRLIEQVDSEGTLNSRRPSDTTKHSTDLPDYTRFQDRSVGCEKKDYKKDVITAPCGNGWGG